MLQITLEESTPAMLSKIDIALDSYAAEAQKDARKNNLYEQNIASSIWHLKPKESMSPLLILGGMGIFAGFEAMQMAIQRAGYKKEILLYQATHIPDRTEAILKLKDEKNPAAYRRVVEALGRAVDKGLTQFGKNSQQVDLVVACNTAHFFLEDALKLSRVQKNINFISIISAAKEACRDKNTCSVALQTIGSKLAEVYVSEGQSQFIPTTDKEDTLLMKCIYEGVKAFNPTKTVELGLKFFQTLFTRLPNIEAIVAGCSEIPEIIRLTKATDTQVGKKLKQLVVISPVEEALKQIC